MTTIQAIYQNQITIARGSRAPQVAAGPSSLSSTIDQFADRPEVKHRQWDSKDKLQLQIRGISSGKQTDWLPVGEEIEFADVDAFIQRLRLLKPENLEPLAYRELQQLVDIDSPV